MTRIAYLLGFLLAVTTLVACGGGAGTGPTTKVDPLVTPDERTKITAVTTGGGPSTTAEPRDPEDLLRAVADFYRTVKSFEVEVTQTWHTGSTKGLADSQLQYSFRIQRPNQLAVLGTDCVSFCSNGTRRYLYSPTLSRYSECEAPETMAEAATESEYRLVAGETRPFLLHFLEEDAYERMRNDITYLKYRGAVRLDKAQAHYLAITYAGMDVDMYISTGKEPVVQRLVVSSVQANIPAVVPKGVKPPPPPKGGKAATTVRRIRTESYQDWRLNANLPVFAAFPIAPPADATKVSSLAWDLRPAGEIMNAWVGKIAPPLELPLLDGGTLKLAEHRNKQIVVLNFFTTTRRDCEWQVPTVAATTSAYADEVVQYAVNEREDSETIQAFMSKHAVDSHVALDAFARAAQTFRVLNLPTVVLIDSQGRVRSVHSDVSESFVDRLQAELRALVHEGKLDTELLERISPEMPASELVEALSVTDTRIRDKAVDALAAKGSESVPLLLSALGSRDAGVRHWSAVALEELGNKSLPAANTLIKLLEDRDPAVRLAAARALGRIGSEVVPRLAALISSKTAGINTRIGAATALGNASGAGEEAVRPLVDALHDRDRRVRAAATNGLSSMGAPAVTVLVAALDDENETAYSAAGVALGRMGEVAVPALIKALESPKVTVRYTACLALGKIGSGATSAVDALKKAAKDPDSNVRFYAEQALRDIE
jgi:HEAT repeat protein